jgi:RimJ/RimL family protein N-acetyltransferase
MITLRPLSAENMEDVRQWRMDIPETLRTPYMLTYEQQQDYYRTVICDRRSTTRYWGVWDGEVFVGMGGIENIEWTNRRGEISVLINPERRGKGYGKQAVESFLHQAFHHLGLLNVWGECYYCSPAVGFWQKLVELYGAYSTTHPNVKFFDGKLFNSFWFNFKSRVWR